MSYFLRNISFAFALLLCCASANAGAIFYEFSTTLELDFGPDTAGLDGASVFFSAEIAEGTVFEEDTIGASFYLFHAASHEWRIEGSDSLDGAYADPDGATYYAGWWGRDGFFFEFATFERLVLVQLSSVGPGNPGTLVGPEHMTGSFPSPIVRPDLMFWDTTDGSTYNWANNASSALSGMGIVPIPSSLFLSFLALAALSFLRRRPVG